VVIFDHARFEVACDSDGHRLIGSANSVPPKRDQGSPLGRAADLEDSQIASIATAHNVAPAQAILRWHLQAGRVAIPKSASPRRIANNIDLLSFALTEDEMTTISLLERGLRAGEDVETFN
jgi:2,5-diketo-D-gluconate reductase A